MKTEVALINQPSLLAKIAARYSVEPNKMLSTLKATAFKVKDGEASNEQLIALLIVADQYRLNPFTKEIFAFPDSRNGIVPVVSVDGWTRIINEHDAMDGVEFIDGPEEKGTPAWIECVIYRKDRSHPTKVRERLSEVKRDTQPWKSHPSRMLRHKALIQCARIAFGFAGIYDQDEAERIIEMGDVERTDTAQTATAKTAEGIKARLTAAKPEETEAPTDSAKAADDFGLPADYGSEPEKV